MKGKALKALGVSGRVIILSLFLLGVLLPIYWLFITSFKTVDDINSLSISYWPREFTFQNYIDLWNTTKFANYLANSLVVTLISSFFIILFSIMGGYALARYQFRGKKPVLLTLLTSQMIPTILLFIPMFLIFGKLKLINSLGSLIILYTVFGTPFCLIMLKSFFEKIPVSLEEAASIDGCSRMQALVFVVIPLLVPGIVATFVFAFTSGWNELLAGVMFISKEELKTIPVGISTFVGKFSVNWGQMSAACMLSMIPTFVFFAVVQRHVVAGLTQGAVKE